MILHELAHGMHDRLPDRYDNETVLNAFRQAMQEKKYDHILRANGRQVKAYAATNQMEYFAETTEAFFGRNDFYPFVRAELKAHDPLMYKILKQVWGHSHADNYLWKVTSLPETTPWDLNELSRAPTFDWSDAKSPIRALHYQGEPFRGNPTRVFAYYATPGSLSGNTFADVSLPAVVLVHGGGGTAFKDWVALWASRGYAAIAMDLSGRGADRQRLDDGGPEQTDEFKFGQIDAPVHEQWPYHAVANVIRAHSLLRSFPEVDESRTAVTGISWGGYVTCIVAGLDRRFRAAVPVYGCGFLDKAGAWAPKLQSMNPERRDTWTQLWDPASYLGSAEIPVFLLTGTNDHFYSLDSHARTCRLPNRQTRNLRVTIGMPHSHQAGWVPREIGMFIDQHLCGATPLPVVDRPEMVDDSVEAAVTSASELVSANLHYTTSIAEVKDRPWRSAPAEINENRIVCDLLAPETSAWFVTVTDNRGATVSSEVVFADLGIPPPR
jgi:dienelactone hydrolase